MFRQVFLYMKIILILSACASCAHSPQIETIDDKLYMELYGNRPLSTKHAVVNLCTLPFERNHYDNICEIAYDFGNIRVIEIVDGGEGNFAKIALESGKISYITLDDLTKIDQSLRPFPRIGMNKNQAMDTNWGLPEKRNITSSNGGRSEQWVFPGRGYMYIENGILTTIQKTE